MDLKKIFVVGTLGFIIICLGLFYRLSALSASKNGQMVGENAKSKYDQMEEKIHTLEETVKHHRASMQEIENLVFKKDSLDDLNHGLEAIVHPNQLQLEQDGRDDAPKEDELPVAPMPHIENSDFSSTCSSALGMGHQAKSDINMLNVYDILEFDNPDGGAWKQGWDVKIDEGRFSSENKLRVFVIPHSHNDPGWIKTFERYFSDQTKGILDTLLDKMSANSELKFIWAEISYFDLWWSGLDDKDKDRVQKLVDTKQLEFVTGGWVMPDESSAHYYSVLTQLIEGHQWLKHHMNYTTKNGWSIDPFGMSPTMAYLLRRVGFKNMLIQRTHYAVKKHLARLQQLEFKWRQNWDSDGTTDIFCHMMPFYSYDVPHTCGPEPKICCQFDFKRMRTVSQMTCPWHAPPVPIVAKNVRERSLMLLDQYKKKSMLYKTNVLLVPLGDDFRWEDSKEWDAQSQNYLRIMNYINSKPELEAEVKFGTLDDYFSALSTEVQNGHFNPSVLSGDFFTYADVNDNYWSGYFTSRPFYKSFERSLMASLRAAHLSFTLMTAEVYHRSTQTNVLQKEFVKSLLGRLIKSRRTLGLFQHHDGITGTSKDHVMVDYGKKMLNAINDCNHVMQQSLQVLTSFKNAVFNFEDMLPDAQFFEPVLSRDKYDALPHFGRVVLDDEFNEKVVTVYNPVGRLRTQLVRVYISTARVEVFDLNGKQIEADILPVFTEKTVISDDLFELNFLAEVDALSVKSFLVKFSTNAKEFTKPTILLLNPGTVLTTPEQFPVHIVEEGEAIEISNGVLTLGFDNAGFISSAKLNGEDHHLSIGFYKYGARTGREASGLYLFLPDGEAKKLYVGKPFAKIVKGQLQSYVEVWLDNVKHRITLYSHAGFERNSFEVKNLVDIRDKENFELMMRFHTNIKSGTDFFTDLNAFQIIKRRHYDKIPIQGNYYPIPSAAYIEDDHLRLSVLSAQPLATASLNSGQLDIILDRTLAQDDNRGAGQGDQDNVETVNVFKILFEAPHCHDPEKSKNSPMLSLQSHVTQEDLLHPVQTFIRMLDSSNPESTSLSDYTLNSGVTLPCDVQILDATPLPYYAEPKDDSTFVPTPNSGLLLRRVGFDGEFLNERGTPFSHCDDKQLGLFTPDKIFGDLINHEVKQMTLNFIHDGETLESNESILMRPMEVYGFLIKYNGKVTSS